MSALERLELTDKQRRILGDVLAQFGGCFDVVLAFGSRATGTARPGSDLDLAVIGGGAGRAGDLKAALERSDLPFVCDVVPIDSRLAQSMRDSIQRDGLALAGTQATHWKDLMP